MLAAGSPDTQESDAKAVLARALQDEGKFAERIIYKGALIYNALM